MKDEEAVLPGERSMKRHLGVSQVNDGRQIKAVDVKLLKTDSMILSRATSTLLGPPSRVNCEEQTVVLSGCPGVSQ